MVYRTPNWLQPIEIACHLGQDRVALSKIQQNIRSKMSQSPLTNAQQFTKNFEAHLVAVYSNIIQ